MPKSGDSQHKQEVDRVRARDMLDDGKKPSEIMKKLKRSKKFVSDVKNNRPTVYACKTKPRTGAKTKLTLAAQVIIRQSRGKKKGSTRKLKKQIKQAAAGK